MKRLLWCAAVALGEMIRPRPGRTRRRHPQKARSSRRNAPPQLEQLDARTLPSVTHSPLTHSLTVNGDDGGWCGMTTSRSAATPTTP
jgi:hypothetical protein